MLYARCCHGTYTESSWVVYGGEFVHTNFGRGGSSSVRHSACNAQVPSPVSSDVKALAQALNARADLERVDGRGSGADVVGTRTDGEECLSVPPPSSVSASAVTSSGTRMSPGLAARMQVPPRVGDVVFGILFITVHIFSLAVATVR